MVRERRRKLPTRESLRSSPEEELLLAELRRRLPAGADTRPPSRQVAADATGSVRVTVDARGDVSEVEVSPDWRDRLQEEDLAEAVFQAYHTARHKAIEAFAVAVLVAERAGLAPPDLPPAAPHQPNHEVPVDQDRIGPHGCLAARLHGTAVVSMVGDTVRISCAPTEHLREDALAVLSAAGRTGNRLSRNRTS